MPHNSCPASLQLVRDMPSLRALTWQEAWPNLPDSEMGTDAQGVLSSQRQGGRTRTSRSSPHTGLPLSSCPSPEARDFPSGLPTPLPSRPGPPPWGPYCRLASGDCSHTPSLSPSPGLPQRLPDCTLLTRDLPMRLKTDFLTLDVHGESGGYANMFPGASQLHHQLPEPPIARG